MNKNKMTYTEKKEIKEELEKINFHKSLKKFFKVNTEIIISLIPFLLIINYGGNMKYLIVSDLYWVILIVLLVVVLLSYYAYSIYSIKNTLLEFISSILLVITFFLYMFISVDISRNAICIASETNGNTEINERCNKLKEK